MRRRKDVSNRSVSVRYQLRRHDDVSAWSAMSRPISDLNETSLRRLMPGGKKPLTLFFQARPTPLPIINNYYNVQPPYYSNSSYYSGLGSTHNTVDQIDVKDIVNRIINSGKKCFSYGFKEGLISSIFIKKQFKLRRIIRQVNDLLRDECKRNNFQLVSNDNITREVLWRDGLHLNNDSTYIFASNLVDYLNDFIFSKSIWLSEDDNTTVGKDNCKQGFDSPVE